MYADLLDFTGYSFKKGIDSSKLVRGLRSDLNKQPLLAHLTCGMCSGIVIQGLECPKCEAVFCTPCSKAWEASESAKMFTTPCRCEGKVNLTDKRGSSSRSRGANIPPKSILVLRPMSSFRWEFMDQIRFKCKHNGCPYHQTYEEMILGTHEFVDCQYRSITCEGCGEKFT